STCIKVINTLDFSQHFWCGCGAYTYRERQKRQLNVRKETPIEKTNHFRLCRATAVSRRIFSEFRRSDEIETSCERNRAASACVRSDRKHQLPDASLRTRVVREKNNCLSLASPGNGPGYRWRCSS